MNKMFLAVIALVSLITVGCSSSDSAKPTKCSAVANGAYSETVTITSSTCGGVGKSFEQTIYVGGTDDSGCTITNETSSNTCEVDFQMKCSDGGFANAHLECSNSNCSSLNGTMTAHYPNGCIVSMNFDAEKL